MTNPTARAAATRARTLAAVLTHRAHAHPAETTFRTIAALLITAAHAFETEEAPVLDGRVLTNVIPADASFALLDADMAAEDNPRHAYLRHVVRYILVPLFGALPHLPDLDPESEALSFQHLGITDEITRTASGLNNTSSSTTRYALLARLLDLHHQLARLAETIAADNARRAAR